MLCPSILEVVAQKIQLSLVLISFHLSCCLRGIHIYTGVDCIQHILCLHGGHDLLAHYAMQSSEPDHI